ncbi:MAG TPA: hypothetical protein PKD16_18855 [Saprospiraceae bacterium]|nr:hypothetical protein [Saprospiraceae bacterium]HMT72232.1 hypothetical protein [Saprospiraceae bacterium]
MKNIRYFFFATLILAFSCSKDSMISDMDNEMDDKYNVNIGSYKLLQSSIDAMPYLGKKSIVFVDSSANEMVFVINESPILEGNVTLFTYNVYQAGDIVNYHYSRQYKTFLISNDSSGLEFICSLESTPYYTEPQKKFVADVFNVIIKNPNDQNSFRQVFYHITNQRTWPITTNTPPISEKIILNRTFQDVLIDDFTNPLSIVHFNYEFGIISFTDFDGKLWRFERME